jgi:DNA-binding MarR family transcriptional regulator
VTSQVADQAINILQHTVLTLVRRDGPDLRARQISIFLICYLDNKAHTVRSLAKHLEVPKSSITRALDRLSKFDLVRRKIDPKDHRSVCVQQTEKGAEFLRDLRSIMSEAGKLVVSSNDGASRSTDGRPFPRHQP